MICEKSKNKISRREFLQNSGIGLMGTLLLPQQMTTLSHVLDLKKNIPIYAHLWVYASKFPPHWDCTPVLETIFSDLSSAGIDGVELMEANLRHDNSTSKINSYIQKYKLPVSGSSYGVGFKMWDRSQHKEILDDINIVIPRLREVGGTTFGISVGSSDHIKTDSDLDAQAFILKQIVTICNDNGIQANLHNHTYEVENDLHDLKGTLERLPDIKLGPDINWLIRAGVDPVEFITTYGKQITYLHIRDQYEDGTWTEYVGQGNTDFNTISQALKEQDFNGKVAIELAFPNDFIPQHTLIEDWKKSRVFIEKTFGW